MVTSMASTPTVCASENCPLFDCQRRVQGPRTHSWLRRMWELADLGYPAHAFPMSLQGKSHKVQKSTGHVLQDKQAKLARIKLRGIILSDARPPQRHKKYY